jgi:hypothetical protein
MQTLDQILERLRLIAEEVTTGAADTRRPSWAPALRGTGPSGWWGAKTFEEDQLYFNENRAFGSDEINFKFNVT